MKRLMINRGRHIIIKSTPDAEITDLTQKQRIGHIYLIFLPITTIILYVKNSTQICGFCFVKSVGVFGIVLFKYQGKRSAMRELKSQSSASVWLTSHNIRIFSKVYKISFLRYFNLKQRIIKNQQPGFLTRLSVQKIFIRIKLHYTHFYKAYFLRCQIPLELFFCPLS